MGIDGMFFFYKHKTADEMRISDWSSDVCSSDLVTLNILKALGERVIDIHYQHATLEINTEDFQLMTLDSVGKNARSEERSVGQECVSTCSSRWWSNY